MQLPAEHVVAQVPIVEEVVQAVTGTAVGWGFDQVAEGVASWVMGAVGFFVDGTVNFLVTSASPDVTAAWFTGPESPLGTVRNLAGVMLLGFVLLGLLQGLLTGDIGGMVRRMALDLPMTVLGIVALTVVVDRLLQLTDALSTTVLGNADGQALHFMSGFGVTVVGLTQGFAAVLLGLVAILAAFLVWLELMVRSVLVYLLVALSPLAFATTVWPAARGVLRRTIELLLAVILSKLVISIAIATGVAALSGAGTAAPADAAITDEVATSMGTLFAGTAILAMAAFAPFLLLKLIPLAEAALVAQGVSRAPVRGAQATMSNVYYAQSLTRLAGGAGQAKLATASSQPPAAWAVGPGTTVPPPGIGGGWSVVGAGVAGGPSGVAVAGGASAITGAARSIRGAAEGIADPPSRAGHPRQPPTDGPSRSEER